MNPAVASRKSRRPPDAEVLRVVRDLYERGQTVEALRQAEAFAPLAAWGGSEPCVLAARIAANAGAPRLSLRLILRARRANPSNLEALAHYGYELLNRRGALAAWQALRTCPEADHAPAEPRAELLALKARAAADLRDFANAEVLLERAEALDPNSAWIRLQRAFLLESQDHIEEALAAAQAACARHPHPFYRPGVQTLAHLLQLLDRDDEAIALLREAGAVLRNGPVAGQRYGLLTENGRWPEAEEALEQFVALSPLLEAPGRNWTEAQRARLAYHLGRRAQAAQRAARLDDRFHREFAARLQAAPASPERVQLDVTFRPAAFQNLRAGNARGPGPFLADGGGSSQAGGGDVL